MTKKKSGFPESVCQLRLASSLLQAKQVQLHKQSTSLAHSTPFFPRGWRLFPFTHSLFQAFHRISPGCLLHKAKNWANRASMDSITCSSWGTGYKGNLKIIKNERPTTELGLISVNKTAQHWVNVSYYHV